MTFAKGRKWMEDAEQKGLVADSMEVRLDLMRRVKAGEITLAEAQKRLAAIKRLAKTRGQVTRNQAYLGKLP